MSEVMPSEIVKIIDQFFDHARVEGGPTKYLQRGHSPHLRGVVDLLDGVPRELLTLSSADYATFALVGSLIKQQLILWQHGAPESLALIGGVDPVTVVRRLLAKCPDEYPPPSSTVLLFIDDRTLGESIRNDVGATQRALANSEWKAATVLAGAAIEALLHWVLTRDFSSEVAEAAKDEGLQVRSSLDAWTLGDFIQVARRLDVIRPDTATSAMLAKDYRNLIHPGRAARTGQACNRGTTYTAVGALERVITDVEEYCAKE